MIAELEVSSADASGYKSNGAGVQYHEEYHDQLSPLLGYAHGSHGGCIQVPGEIDIDEVDGQVDHLFANRR